LTDLSFRPFYPEWRPNSRHRARSQKDQLETSKTLHSRCSFAIAQSSSPKGIGAATGVVRLAATLRDKVHDRGSRKDQSERKPKRTRRRHRHHRDSDAGARAMSAVSAAQLLNRRAVPPAMPPAPSPAPRCYAPGINKVNARQALCAAPVGRSQPDQQQL
jgi:hypothetical protein